MVKLKRMPFTLIAVALAAIAPLSLVGCGSDRDRARGYVESGNAILAGVQSRYGETGGRVDRMFDKGVVDEIRDLKKKKPGRIARF